MGGEEKLTVMSFGEKDYDIYADKGRLHIEKREETSSQGSDQSAKADAGKLRLTLVPSELIWDVAAIREYGTAKYGDPENWRLVEVERFRDAAYRHFLRYLEDPCGVDEESGLPHLWHWLCNGAFLAELEKGNFETLRKGLGII